MELKLQGVAGKEQRHAFHSRPYDGLAKCGVALCLQFQLGDIGRPERRSFVESELGESVRRK
jgi:hypothetical protein